MEQANQDPLLKLVKLMMKCEAETIHSFSQRKNKTAWKTVASFSSLTSQENQSILDLLRLRKIRVRLGSVLDFGSSNNLN